MIDFEISCSRMKSNDFSDHYDYCCYGLGNTETEAFEDCLHALNHCVGLDFETINRIQTKFGAIAGLVQADEHGSYHVKIQWSES